MNKVTKVVPTDVYLSGELERIEFHDLEGNFIAQSVWDWDTDPEQTPANREEFRRWSYKMIGQLDNGAFEVLR